MAMESRGLSTWQGTALVVGTGGIGTALLEALAKRAPDLQLLGASRKWPSAWEDGALAGTAFVAVDLTKPSSLEGLQRRLGDLPPLRVVLNTAGVLHGPDLQPDLAASGPGTATRRRPADESESHRPGR
jgi:nucleoside-diphosphate-sugar epimerase